MAVSGRIWPSVVEQMWYTPAPSSSTSSAVSVTSAASPAVYDVNGPRGGVSVRKR
jgi:hypothetical protein